MAAVALVAYTLTRAPSISWAVGVSDSGELAAATYVLGVPHPTGYPLYMLVGWCVSHLPVGPEPAVRLTALSAAGGAVAAGLACLLAGLISRPSGTGQRALIHSVGPVAAGLGCAALPSFWQQATAPETRSLAMMLVMGTLLVLVWAVVRHDPRLLVVAWALWGFALADHLLCLALFPALLLSTIALAPGAAAPAGPRRRWSRHGLWLRAVAALVPGLSLYAYLPIRAMAHPPLNWGDPQTPGQFLWEVSGAQYRSFMGAPLADVPAHLAERLATSWHALGAGYCIAGCFGLALLLWRERLVGTCLLSVCLVSIAQSALYGAGSAPIYLLPCEALLCTATGYLLCNPPALRLRVGARRLLALVALIVLGVTLAIDVGQARMLYADPDDK
ncbi:MAG TPA: DUF2723 domain-containing protein, partial [Chloroflexota bacterium]|nr:DUF2723 domain-containing protein [Chloroflexota bacterium]